MCHCRHVSTERALSATTILALARDTWHGFDIEWLAMIRTGSSQRATRTPYLPGVLPRGACRCNSATT